MIEVISKFIDNFDIFANLVGYEKIGKLQKEWFEKLFKNNQELVILQAHRNAYKTTTIIISVVLLLMFMPKITILIIRKSEELATQMLYEIKKILKTEEVRYIMNKLFNIDTYKIKENQSQIDLGFTNREPNIMVVGLGKNITGLHFDLIICDDIVTEKDRYSKKERETTKRFFFELKNILKKESRYKKIVLTGTTWHENDLFSELEKSYNHKILRYDIYNTGIFSEQEIKEMARTMPKSLFACNYELKHINDEDSYFTNEKYIDFDFSQTKNYALVDTAFDGNDYTAISILTNYDNKIIVTGYVYKENTYKIQDKIISVINNYNVCKLWIEANADKGITARELQKKLNIPIIAYNESQNKHIKIITTIKKYWRDIYFCESCQNDYIQQILGYTDFAANDDAPDSLATLLQKTQKKETILISEKVS